LTHKKQKREREREREIINRVKENKTMIANDSQVARGRKTKKTTMP